LHDAAELYLLLKRETQKHILIHINMDNTKKIRDFCNNRRISLLAEIPFDQEVAASLVNCMPFVDFSSKSPTKDIIIKLSRRLIEEID
jgi:MinD superfamily P-loop ATPase